MARGERKGIEQVVTSAVFDLMRSKPIPQITVSEVVAAARIARSSFYRYFDSVDDVVRKSEALFFDDMRAVNDVAIRTRLAHVSLEPTESMVQRMESMLAHRDWVLLLMGENGDPMFSHRMTATMSEYFRAKFRGLSTSAADMDLYISFVVAGHHNLVLTWLERYPQMPPRRVALMLNRLMYAALDTDGLGGFLVPGGLNQSHKSDIG